MRGGYDRIKWFKVRADVQTAEELAHERRTALDACAPYRGKMRVDYEASRIDNWALTCSPIVENGSYVVVECANLEDAIAFTAEANGATEHEVTARIQVGMVCSGKPRRGRKPTGD